MSSGTAINAKENSFRGVNVGSAVSESKGASSRGVRSFLFLRRMMTTEKFHLVFA
jgi:hypothetical protein